MRIGILADIHEEVERLAEALKRLRAEGVDAIVELGDIFEMGKRIGPTVELLTDAGAVGVWGNHDFGLCREVDDWTRDRFGGPVLDYMATLEPRLELDGCLFAHVDPCYDACLTESFYHHPDAPPTNPERVAACLDSGPQRRMFIGHYHRWQAADESGRLDWDGSRPLRFEPERRYLIVVGPLMDGHFAVLDTAADVLTPRTVEVRS